ncbi:disease resistance protein At4g27190-like isoform X1 [Camellia sinensis]|uniref:disease resistance protein At4g27190-like isoform X1 n=1 Tax=Camellia sinensis TaxID=4442 RepID=UPI001035D662|nr:disease resistance protein At4g27190-like isoform X1 [Camellia sinensis]
MVLNYVLPVVMKIGEYLVAPVGRQFCYLIFYDRNIKNLEKQVQKLEDKRFGVQKSVDEAEAKRETIAPGVERWLKTVNDLNEEAKKFLEVEVKANKGCLNGWCPNLKSRYSLSRKATKKTQSVEELRGAGVFSTVSYPTVVPSVGTTFAFTGGFKGFESRRSIMNGVMEVLTDDRIHVIGICGIGGVGKTTMVNEVAKKVEEKKMFDVIVMVVVSQNPNLITIQGQIAKILDLQDFGGNNLPTGAGKIRSKILSFGRVLVILDDVWKRLELNDIGIPFGDNHKGCKIVMTSRNKDVCNSMGTHENFEVGILHKEEAWNLFKEMAEISDEGTSHPTGLQLMQMAVAKECGGLPIAIVTVGRALRCKNKYSWDSALEQLRKSMVKNISGVDEKVFKSLELSYDSLDSDEAKKCFLLCSLFPEDFDIPIEVLVRYAIGIELFERIDSVHQARNRVYFIVDDLKKCYLLMESENEECIKMHDVVRDVAISIACRKEHLIVVRCDEVLKEWPKKDRLEKNAIISLKVDGMHGLPGNLEFPNLHLLKLDCNARLPLISSYDLHKEMAKVKVQETLDSFYQGMKELKVLALSDMYSSLPASLQRLTNLRTLSLFRCRLIDDDISIIGALENLEILSFAGSYIKELPKEIIGHLAQLKVLDLLGCVVEKIYPGVLSSLSKLEELYVGHSFDSLSEDEESKEGSKAIIDELASLSNLVALDIALIDISFWPRGLVIERLKKFNITVGFLPLRNPCYRLSNQLMLQHQIMSDIIELRLNLLLKSTEILYLIARIKGLKILCDLVDEDGFECLTKLSIRELYDLEYLINTADGVPQSAFPVLEFLHLHHLPNFKGITSHECRLPNKAFSALKLLTLYSLPELANLWKGPTQLVWLGNLTSVIVWGCDKLESMFSLSTARDLVQLQHLQITHCPMMEVIVSSEGGEHEIAAIATDKIEFPKLKQLCLEYMPSFSAICKAMNAIELPQLSSLTLWVMPKLKRLCLASESESNCDPIIQPLFNDKVKLIKLREMTVRCCHELSNILFPSNSVKGMPNLEVLEVTNCQSIGVAFDLEGLVWEEGISDMALPSLIEVKLICLPKLTHVWKDNSPGILGFQNLRSLVVDECDNLRNLVSYSLAKLLVKLQEIDVTECDMMESIIGNEPNADDVVITNMIIFPQLSSLKLRDLPNLRSFCSEACTFGGSLLKTIQLINCPKMKILPSAFQRKLDQQKADFSTSSQFHLLDGKDKLATIEAKLTMTVKLCHGLSNILFPCNSIKGMQNLELLEVMDCRSIGVAFDLEGLVWEGISDMALPSLKKVELRRLPKLTHVWKDNSPGIQSFQNLRSLEVHDCDSLRNLFSCSLAKLLVKLQEIEVTECDMMESIIGNEPNVDDAVITNMIMLPQLSSLKLRDLPNLRSFCSKACTFEGSLLKTIEAIDCPKMKILPSAFQSKLEQQKAGFSTSSQLHLLDGKFIFSNWFEYNFGKLTITDINGSIEMWHNQLEVDHLDKVRFMLVQWCEKLSNVISSNLMQRLRYLERLKVWWCDSLETIFDLQGSVCAATTGEEGTSITWFEDLKFMYLPKLTHIWTNVFQRTYSFKNLKSLEVERCDNLRYIFTISMVKVLWCLEYVRIENCEKVEKIVTREEEEEEEDKDDEADDDNDDDNDNDEMGKINIFIVEEEEEEEDDEVDNDNDNDERGKINIFNVELENLPSLMCIGIPKSQIWIFKLRVDICPKYRGYDVEEE